jgi:site-specific DNA-methyltransferase (adenine-specific)
MRGRKTIDASDNKAVLGGMAAKNNGRYNGNGRHWATPPEVFDPLHAEFNFTLDPCATVATAKCTKFYTEDDDGLAQSWAGHRVFMNPPYGREVYAWTKKAREEAERGALVVGLLPASCDLKWWHDDIVDRAEVRYIRGRVRFLTDGPYRASGFFASVVVIWRPGAKSEVTLLRDKIEDLEWQLEAAPEGYGVI